MPLAIGCRPFGATFLLAAVKIQGDQLAGAGYLQPSAGDQQVAAGGAAGGQVVCIFILKQFIEEMPGELFESAQLDGAGHLQQIVHLVLPMSGSVLATLAIMQFIANWNSLVLPLVVMRDDARHQCRNRLSN